MTQLPRAGTAVYLQEFLRIERTSDLQRKSPGVRGFFREELFSEETSLVKRVPPPGPANPKTSPTKNRRTDQQRSDEPRCYRTLGDFGGRLLRRVCRPDAAGSAGHSGLSGRPRNKRSRETKIFP